MASLDNIRMWWTRGRFKTKDRFEYFEKLILLLDNQVQLLEATAKLQEVYSDAGRRRNNIVALVAADCTEALSNGKPLSAAMERWVPFDEVSLIEAGEHTGDLQGAFRRVMTVIDAKRQVAGAVQKATLYPAALLAQGVYLMHKISQDLVPKLMRNATDAESLTGAAYALKVLADYVVRFGPITLAGAIAALVLIIGSLPVYAGGARYYLDKLPPWSFYRMVHGSTFLLNVGVLLGSGVKLSDALALMAKRAKPWLRTRLEDTLYGVHVGLNLGAALKNAGHDFPDRKAVQFLQIVSGRDGIEGNIERFGARWMEESVKGLQAMAGTLLATAIVLNGGLMLLVLVGASQMSDAALLSLQR
jgi:type II secretory pathway component PulF